MASELVPFDEAAKLLKLTPEQLQDLVSRRELSPLRGTSPPKFKMEDLQRAAEDRGIALGGEETPSFDESSLEFEAPEPEEESVGGASSSILVSEQELGASPNPSSTVIGDEEGSGGHDSDLTLASEGGQAPSAAGSDLRLEVPPGESGLQQKAESSAGPTVASYGDAPTQAFSAESDLKLAPADESPAAESPGGAGSDLEPTDSDLEKMGGSDLELSGDSGLDLGGEVAPGAGESDLLLASASDVGPGDTGKLDSRAQRSDLDFATDDVDIDLEDSGSALDLGDEESSGSALDGDIALAGDSGINLTKPSDSGIDLATADESGISVGGPGESGFMLEDEDALQLEGGSSGDAIELPEDVDIVSLEESSVSEAPTQLKSEDDFDLTPVEGAVEDESDSGSQVIALETEELDAEAPTQLGDLGVGAVDVQPGEAIIAEEPSDAGLATMPVGQPGMAPAPYEQAQYPTQELPEAPYTMWQIGSLAVVALTLTVAGVMMVDVVRNIWSFDQPYGASSAIMDSILSALGI